MNRISVDHPRHELLELLSSSPVDLQRATEMIGHDAPLMRAISRLEGSADIALPVRIVSIGLDPLRQLVSTLPDFPKQGERATS